ncbi:MAG: choice-of-anchor D domain-containing protein [Myxococcales bacterium]|nr:choice-of-anchor D domain-containing protein [Myxococcales bacterium]
MRKLYIPLMLFLFVGGTFFPGCQCGVTLRTDPDIGPRQLKTDLPEGLLKFDQLQRLSQTKPFLLYNDGTLPLNVISFQIIDDPEGIYSIVESPSQQKPFTLEPGIKFSVSFTVRFRARRPGNYTAKMRFFAPSADNADEDGYFYVPMPGERGKFGPLFDCGEGLDFGKVAFGSSKELTCEVKNAGTAPLLINGFKYKLKEGNTPIDFAWIAPELPLRIPPGDTGVTIRVVYKPSDFPPEKDEGVYILETNLPAENDEEKAQLSVKGTTIVPKIALIPVYPSCSEGLDCQLLDQRLDCREDSYDQKKRCDTADGQNPLMKFPRTLPGKLERKIFLVRNTGNAPLQVTGMEWVAGGSADFALLVPFSPFVLQGGEERAVEVLYKPSDNNKDQGQLRVLSNAYQQPEALMDVEAAAIGCKLAIDPQKIEFTKAETREVVLRNEGDEMCQIKSVTLRFKQERVFALQNIPDPRDLIAPNASRTMQVQHTVNPKATPDIADVASNDFDQPDQEVVLIPFIPRPEKCALIANPEILDYQIVQPGQNKNLTTTFFNIGRAPCRITAAQVIGLSPSNNKAFALVKELTLPLILPEGQPLSMEVRYSPTQASNYEGTLILDTPEGETTTTQVTLRGTSGSPCLDVIPRIVDFGTPRFTCAARDQTVRIVHVGAPTCPSQITIQGVSLDANTSTEFSLKRTEPVIPTGGLGLQAGQSVEVTLGYTPTDLGQDRGTLEIKHTFAPQSPLFVPLQGEGIQEDEQKDVFNQNTTPAADILFVVDNSCSMGEEQQNLATNFQSFINWAIRLNVDYHIGVTTTDTTGRLAPAGCLRRGTSAQFPGTISPFISLRTNDPTGVFGSMVNVGTRGSAVERGLDAAHKALSLPTKDDPNCNQGFYRDAASLSLIFLSDERDQSPLSESFYISFFRNLKGPHNTDLIRASVVVGPPPDGCTNPGTGRATAAPKYWAVATALRGEKANICDPDWSTTLNRIGAVTFGLRDQFFLSRTPEPPTIVVKVDGANIPQSATNGWVYESSSNSIVFSASARPNIGSKIEVTYKAICQ